MPAIGPKYLPCKVITAWRCLTRFSGFCCASTVPAAAPSTSATRTATALTFMGTPPRWVIRGKTAAGGTLFRLAQSRGVFGQRLDLAVVERRRDAAHHAVRVVCARALAERLELGRQVFGVLAGEARELRRHAGPGGPMATGARRHVA